VKLPTPIDPSTPSYQHNNQHPQSDHTVHELKMATQSSIIWPKHFQPGTTDNFVSNERIAKDITSTQM